MKAVIGRITFNNNQRRNSSLTMIQTEAANRGLTPYPMTFEGVDVTGTWSGTYNGVPALRLSYSGPNEAAEAAYAALFEWMDSRGFIGEDSWSGAVLLGGS